jgi:hypothetical protein
LTDPQEDPGWGFVWKVVVPGAGRPARFKNGSALVTTRMLFASFAWAIVAFGIVLAFLDLGSADALDPGVGVAIVVGVGVVSLVAGRFLPGLDGSSLGRLGQTYRTRLFTGLAIGEAVALIGFVLAFLAGTILTYLVALPFTAIGFARVAPTRSNIERDEQELQALGAAASLQQVLLGGTFG